MGEPIELRSPIPVETPLGRGWAIIFNSDAAESWWTVILNETRAFVMFRQSEICASRSYTYGRSVSDDEMRQIIGAGALPGKSRRHILPRVNKPRVRSRRSGKARG